MNSKHVQNCVKYIPNRVHFAFSYFFRLDAPLQNRLEAVVYQYMLILARNAKIGQNKASKYVQWGSKENSKSCIFQWGIFKMGCMRLCRILLSLVSQPKKILGE